METWFLIIVTACIAALIKAFLSFNSKSKPRSNYPPGPRRIPIITTIVWLRRPFAEVEAALRVLRNKFGSIVTLPSSSSRPVIFIFDRALAHQALVHNGAIFADRPKPLPVTKIIGSNQHNISSAGYGPTWRLLRRNLTSQIVHSSKLKEFSYARKWVLQILIGRLKGSVDESKDGAIKVMDHFRFAMFCLLVFMCFGDKLDESQVKEIEAVQQGLLVSFLSRFRVLNLQPWLTRILFRSRWDELFNMKKKQEDVLMPHIRARKQKGETADDESSRLVTSYVDTLLTLELSDDGSTDKRKLSDEELVSACSEFLNAGTDTTSTALQWIMANLVKYPSVQSKLSNEIRGVIGVTAEEVGEDELSKMPYLKAVVLEGLRRHPPGHFVLPHSVTHDVELNGYTLPKNAVINFAVAEMGWDPEVWEEPMLFKPERFMSSQGSDIREDFDITGSREIKMMPFGAGRRICPGLELALLHLEYYVANLVWNFEWTAVEGDEVDLTEKQEFTVVMKHPLHAHISPKLIK